jgi:hypothetical protein
MAAALTRSSRIQSVLPLALSQGWSVRRLAGAARISYGSAAELLRGVAQQAETVLDAETGAICSSLAGELRDSVCGAAQALIERVQSLAGKVESAADAERLAKALEASARLADNLDGLAHARAIHKAMVASGDVSFIRGNHGQIPVVHVDPFLKELPQPRTNEQQTDSPKFEKQ